MQTIAGYTDRRAQARGIDFHYLERGDPAAPPMVLLHGLTGHAHIWDHMAPALAEHYHVFAPDQRGHGDTGHAESYATGDFVADLEALVALWGVSRFVLMGLSMGGHNAMAYAAAHPERVERLIVIDIPPRMSREGTPNWEVAARLAKTGHRPFATFDEAVANARAGTPTAPEEHLRYRTHWNLKARDDGGLIFKYDAKVQMGWAPEDLWPRVGSLTMPVLLVRGGKTLVLPRDVAERMIAAMPDAELVEVAESGHSVPTDRPEDLAPIVLRWLGR
jgi:esterase